MRVISPSPDQYTLDSLPVALEIIAKRLLHTPRQTDELEVILYHRVVYERFDFGEGCGRSDINGL